MEVPILIEDKQSFMHCPINDDGSNNGITEINPTLRVTEHIDALQTKLNLLSSACGLGPDRYSFKDGKVYTNEHRSFQLIQNCIRISKIMKSF